MKVSPMAGKTAVPSILIEIPKARDRFITRGGQIRPFPRSAWRSEHPGIGVARSITPSTRYTSSR
jgi:hypothetical protein